MELLIKDTMDLNKSLLLLKILMKLLLILLSFLSIYQANAQTSSDSKYPIDSGYFSSFDRTKIYYEVRGEGKPVVLVHGFIVNSNSWKGTALYKDLMEDGYKVIILDLRGNGKSGKPHNEEAYELAKILPDGVYETPPGDHDHAYTTEDFSEKVIAFLKMHHY